MFKETIKLSPNLLLVGFQKCGSSSLYDLLIQHPQIQGSIPKETFCLVDETYEHYDAINSVKDGRFVWDEFYKHDSMSATKYYLEATAANFYQETAIKYANENNAKIIFILRDPIERFLSTYNYYGATGIHIHPDISISDYYEFVKKKSFDKEPVNYALEHGKYVHYINKWIKYLGKEKVYIVGLNRLLLNKEEEIKKLWFFLALPSHEVELYKNNASAPMKYKKLNRFLVATFRGVGLGKTYFGKLYRNWNQSNPKKNIPDALKEKLLTYYAEEYEHYAGYF